ncbi:hypothetical protein EVJ27_07535 [Exiguobacterium sp. SH3S2]|uniref:hypothetical protein n=1 Tax=Exiguobacterium sp. SH3S2 TaxID=2510956 RepID=UPI00103AE37F|nr:hypothetical protein [Exiguobacterium sp. SH3S2]TCI45713.1 hypothetical protein EVJ28_07535 [Exiguobacterium sp. SH3S3]TCI60922.1 hypothetical protein EVJ27_07535 [Exiguobacterium sp. SH3S2]
MLELIVFWCLALLLALSASAYFVQWRNGRRFVKLLATVGSLLLMGLILLLVVPDTYDRALGRYETESGSCYVVDNQSKQGGVTLWFEEASYDF